MKTDEHHETFLREEITETTEIIKSLERCHNIMRSNDGFTPLDAFDEMNKIIYTKRLTEQMAIDNCKERKFTESYFTRKCKIAEKTDYEKAARIANRLFKEAIDACQPEEKIFDENTEIKICGESIFTIIKQLDNQRFLETEHEIIGLAFENFLTTVFRGERLGQYFTPRSIVNFSIDMIGVSPGEKIIDPAFGSGGFLVEAFKSLTGNIGDTGNKKELLDICGKSFFGTDINKRLTIACKSNMHIHGAKKARLYHHDGLLDINEISENKFDKVFTNPPFGSKVEKRKILDKFELVEKHWKMQRSEVLFLERCIRLLKPGGQMAIVLPDIVLNGDNNLKTREYLLNQCEILAIVSLPNQTFTSSGANVKTSILFLEKKEPEKIYQDKIFMAIPEKIGFDSAGRPDKSDLETVLKVFRKFRTGVAIDYCDMIFSISKKKIKDRLDPKVYRVKEKKIFDYASVKIGELIKERREKIIPAKHPSILFTISGVNNKEGIFTREQVCGENIKKAHYKIEKEDFCYNPSRIEAGSIGLCSFEDEHRIVTGYYKVFYADQKKIVPGFLLALFKTDCFKNFIREKSRGAVRMDLAFEDMKKWQIPLPTLKRQKELLEKAEEQKKIIEHAKLLEKRLANVILPQAKEKRILAEFIVDSIYGISEKPESVGKYPLLRMNNLDLLGNWNLDDMKYINSEIPEKRMLWKGDFIFNRTNSLSHIGKSGVIDFDFSGTWASYLIRFRFDANLNPYYLRYMFAQKKYRIFFASIAKLSGGQANISAKQFADIEIDYHPPDIQKKIIKENDRLFFRLAVLRNIAKDATKKKKEIIESVFRYGILSL